MRRFPIATLALGALAAGGCMVGPAYHRPAPPAVPAGNYKQSPVRFQDNGGWKVASPSDAMLRGDWWQIFDEPELNALETRLNINNQNIKQYFENFMAARAQVAEARSQYWPTITLNPSASIGRVSNSATASSAPSKTSFSLPLDVAWEPDLWGKIRNQVREAQYGAQVSAADLANERLGEQAALAEYFFEIRTQDSLQAILDQTVVADRASLKFAQTQLTTGIGDRIAVLEAQTALDAAVAQATAVGLDRAQYEDAIATLLGVAATGFHLPVRAAICQPPSIPTGMPSQLLERRPDIAVAERTLAEENALIGVGYGAFFPQLSLTGEIGLQASSLKHLFSLPSRIWSVGPSLAQTLFNGGLYRAELRQYQAVYDADIAAYRQTVLVAFQEVEDYLAAVRIDSAQIVQQEQALADAGRLLQLATTRYHTGIAPYTDVLTAQTTDLASEQQLNALQQQRMVAAVELVQALGGGWDTSQLPSPAAVSH